MPVCAFIIMNIHLIGIQGYLQSRLSVLCSVHFSDLFFVCASRKIGILVYLAY